ncbi:glycosyltransferase [sulfur-oxidizing endosymbiont of Gigantopelta aegis]|uniref:glycosyltransferase n=1 Tax=sulfur-oxidizing endosymbiont of Gigantopelta aegis TaxID=2794934 RepID=UPI0018DD7C4E|nr:glycosyltransferase [sulfur-oxidizing endosymbiont of Gigantopelta aegis]
MKKIVLITSQFPCQGGEQFLETEIKYYCESKSVSYTILPLSKNAFVRKIPEHIDANNAFICQSWKRMKFYFFFKSLFRTVLYKELYKEKINLRKLKILFSSITFYQYYYEVMRSFLRKSDKSIDIIFYTYWNNEVTYALESLKNEFDFKLISRIHGIDLYKERRSLGYMPLKKQFNKNIDALYVVTRKAIEYLIDNYNVDKSIIKCGYLGVNDFHIKTLPTDSSKFHMVTCSALKEVKRIDKIIDVLYILSKKFKNIKFIWTHIGEGELYDNLKIKARKKLGEKQNVDFDFLGGLDNVKVYDFYKKNKIDVFVNVSESEGVPVSIMEAMSCSIPIVAPNVGGISDMIVNNESGFLLSNVCTIDEVCNSLENISFFKNTKTRMNSHYIFLEKYNAKKNYTRFIQNINII